MEKSLAFPPQDPNSPATTQRSRAGDFIYSGIVGLMSIVSVVMMTGEFGAATLVVSLLFLSALLMRYTSLRDAPFVSDNISVQAQQMESVRRMRAVIAALPQPVMLLDDKDVIVLTNPACEHYFGSDPTGLNITQAVRAPVALETLTLAKIQNAAEEVELTSTGTSERVSLFFTVPVALREEGGQDGMIVMIRDRTEQRKLERMRTDFIANASHELRTPLTSMIGFIETLQGHARDDAPARDKFLSTMASQAERMLQLVEDLIDLSEIELSQSRPPEDIIELGQIARSVCEAMVPVANRRGGGIGCCATEGEFEAPGDHDEIFQVIQNLVDNALKYGTPKGEGPADVQIRVGKGQPPEIEGALRTGDTIGQLAVRMNAEPEDVNWIQVRDYGEGIDRNDMPRLTERFYRVNPQLSRSKGGTGLGLAIVKHILQRHRGGLQIESIEGGGSAFTCFLPPVAEA